MLASFYVSRIGIVCRLSYKQMSKKSKPTRRKKHIPERTCIACRTSRAKRQLIRIVRTPEGQVCVDETGKQNGRGAYLCRCQTCWQQAIKRGSINRALRITLSAEDLDLLETYAATLPEALPIEDDDSAI